MKGLLKRNECTTRHLLVPVFVLLLVVLSACKQEQFLTNPGNALSFSHDTVSFDTIFAQKGSVTAWIRLRNNSNQPILIQSIRLKSNGLNGYQLNLDGAPGLRFDRVEIPPKDSLYVFVTINGALHPNFETVIQTDSILFETDGPLKVLPLKTTVLSPLEWKAKTIESDTTLHADRPYLIVDSLVIAKDAVLTIQPGTTLYFHDKAYLKVDGRLLAQGTSSARIRFRGDRFDFVIPDFPYDFYPGQWGYIRFTGTSYLNQLNFVDIHGANVGVVMDSSDLNTNKLEIRNAFIHNMIRSAMISKHAAFQVYNAQITNSGEFAVDIQGGKFDFIHCTIANYQNLVTRTGGAFSLSNTNLINNDPTRYLPVEGLLQNCIVAGNSFSEMFLNKQDPSTWSLTFDHCLLPDGEFEEMAMLDSCIFEADPKFLKLGSFAEKYVFDFRIDSTSKARDAGKIQTKIPLDADITGVSRNLDGKPDIGAYEWH